MELEKWLLVSAILCHLMTFFFYIRESLLLRDVRNEYKVKVDEYDRLANILDLEIKFKETQGGE